MAHIMPRWWVSLNLTRPLDVSARTVWTHGSALRLVVLANELEQRLDRIEAGRREERRPVPVTRRELVEPCGELKGSRLLEAPRREKASRSI
jgi:hypothetical protein